MKAFMSGVDAVGCWSIAAMIWVLVRGFRGAFYIANDLFSIGFGMSFWVVIMASTV
jgi:hypothetical protein